MLTRVFSSMFGCFEMYLNRLFYMKAFLLIRLPNSQTQLMKNRSIFAYISFFDSLNHMDTIFELNKYD